MKALVIIVLIALAIILYEVLKSPFNLKEHEEKQRSSPKSSVRVNQSGKKPKRRAKTAKGEAQNRRKSNSTKKKAKK